MPEQPSGARPRDAAAPKPELGGTPLVNVVTLRFFNLAANTPVAVTLDDQGGTSSWTLGPPAMGGIGLSVPGGGTFMLQQLSISANYISAVAVTGMNMLELSLSVISPTNRLIGTVSLPDPVRLSLKSSFDRTNVYDVGSWSLRVAP
jgi:hypothetical protein